MFSGESSLQSPKKGDGFLSKDPYSAKRESFIVTSENLPPQTTMMGAIRYLLLKNEGYHPATDDAARLIGENTFNLAEPKEMGIIQKISPVMLTGLINCEETGKQEQILLLPAPADHLNSNDNQNYPCAYVPIEKYNPKADLGGGYLAWRKGKDNQWIREEKCWYPADKLFTSYTQALHATTEDGADQKDNQSFHMQERVRLIDRRLSKGKGVISTPAFCVAVDLACAIQYGKIQDSFVSLGGRESVFKVRIKEIPNIDLAGTENSDSSKKFYLLSPAWLPENWRNSENGLEMAYLNTRRLRNAVTQVNNGAVSMKLNAGRYIFADAGSVFIFKDHAKMKAFRDTIEGDPHTMCGFNRTAVL